MLPFSTGSGEIPRLYHPRSWIRPVHNPLMRHAVSVSMLTIAGILSVLNPSIDTIPFTGPVPMIRIRASGKEMSIIRDWVEGSES
jgi:hypothetical protein